MPLLSVIVPCANAAETLELTLRSLTRQTFRDFEIIAVDDASVDDTRALLGEWARRDPRIKPIHSEENVGASNARLIGNQAASGDLLGYVDADDWVLPDYYASLVELMTSDPSLEFVRTDHTRVNRTQRWVVRAPEKVKGVPRDPREAILPIHVQSMVDYPSIWAGVWRRGFIEDRGIAEAQGLRSAEDRHWVWRAFARGRRYQAVTDSGYFYRREDNPTALTQVGDISQLDFFRAMDMVHDDLAAQDAPAMWRAKAYRAHLALIAWHHGRLERLAPEVQSAFFERARAVGSRLEAGVLYLACEGLDNNRARLLSELTGREIPSYPA